MRKAGLVCLSFGVVFALAAAVQAAEITYTQTVPLSKTNWEATTVTIPQFNGPGTLVGVKLVLNGHVEGTAKFESLDPQPTTVTMNLQALLKLTKPDNTLIVQVLPVAATSDAVTAYDNATDFAGTSGKTYTNLSADATDFTIYTLPGDLSIFVGGGNIVLPIDAIGQSSGNGAGNLQLQFTTSASAVVEVTYYSAVPEPATMTLLGTGLFAAVGFLRRRRMK